MQTIPFKVGDQIKVTTRDPKANKVHATPFEGIVISLRGTAENKTFTIRKQAAGGIAVEKIIQVNSPLIEKIQVIKSQKVRRAKLFYLRNKK